MIFRRYIHYWGQIRG